MNLTEENLHRNGNVLMTLGSRNVEGFRYKGTGFLIKGSAVMKDSGFEFDTIREKFHWVRKVLVVKTNQIEQTL